MHVSFAQTKTVTGTVTEEGIPLPGVSVTVKGTTEGTQTDFDGKYSIQAKQGDVLLFSFIGMKSKEATVGASNSVNVSLEVEATELSGIVVEGYRQTSKVKSANAVVTVSAEAIQDRPNANFIQTLQGQVAGLQIATGSGQPGANSTVVLRGRGSINGNVEPLYVIDGVQMNVDNFRSINPNEIESVSVLKDAGATAIYGNRGGNGVIIITTKGGKFKDKFSVDYSVVTGFATLQDHDYRLMNSSQLLHLERDYGMGMGVGKTDAEIAELAKVNTDWNKVFFRTSTTTNHNLSLRSGGENLSSFTNFGYFKQDGILDQTGLQRFNLRNNVSGQSDNKKFKYSTKFSVNYSKNQEMGDAGTGSVNQNYVLGANNSVPYFSPSMYQGSQHLFDWYNNTGSMNLTPLMLIDKIKTGFRQNIDEVKVLGSANMSYEIVNGLTARTQLSADYNATNGLTWQNPNSFNSFLFRQPNESSVGFESQSNTRDLQVTSTSSLNYNLTLAEKHNINAGVFFEIHKGHYRYMYGRQNGLDPLYSEPGDNSGWAPFNPSFPNINRPSFTATKFDAALVSYFGNVDYDYDGRFGVNATLRRDGSFRFADGNKWGTFWSVAGRWNITNEKFMDGTSNWLSDLKLRASYGSNGNQLISGQNIFNGANLYAEIANVGSGYDAQAAYLLGRLANPDLRWEIIKQANIGVDFALFNSRLSGSIDVYEKKTEDLFQTTPLSGVTGFTGISSNTGSMKNSGVELYLNYHVIKNQGKGFNFTVNFNGAYNKNELISLPSDNGIVYGGGDFINREGDMLSQYYMVRYAGVNPANGNLLFLDKNDNLTEAPKEEDRVFTGKSAYNPEFQGGFGFDLSYQNFFLNTMFTYVKGIYRYDADLSNYQSPDQIGQFNASTDLLRAWTPDNRYTDIPSLKADNLAFSGMSDRYLTDASYLRLRSIMFGYNFDKQTLESLRINNLRLYVQGENLVTWSKWRGWDAESTRVSDFNQYPTPKIISFGVQIGL